MKYTTCNTNIAVIGGGNIGTQFACVCASKGYKVNLCSSKPELYDGILETIDEFGNRTVGKLNKVCSSIQEAVKECSIIFITHPAFRLKAIADQIQPHIKNNVSICVVPGTGGAEFAFLDCIRKGAALSGLQRVPSVARLEQYGKRVRCEGLRKELFLASVPNCKTNGFSDFYLMYGKSPAIFFRTI
jgi:ketopantoate reductase